MKELIIEFRGEQLEPMGYMGRKRAYISRSSPCYVAYSPTKRGNVVTVTFDQITFDSFQ